MFFLNLTVGEFFTLLVALGGVISALYLLDPAKRTKVVSTLRFWAPTLAAEDRRSRKRMREPWSLILQLVSLALLLLAVAQLQWGTRERRGRDHVLLLDTSSWTAERIGSGTLLDREKQVAREYLAALPSRDRVMLVRLNALATPATPFTSDRVQFENALNESVSQFSALNREQAFALARQAQNWSDRQRGEIVYIGPGLIAAADSASSDPANLRMIQVPAVREHCGIRRIGVKLGDRDANSWQAAVTLKNYGAHPRTVRLKTQFAGTVFSGRTLSLNPGEEASAEYNFVTTTAGRLTAEIQPPDLLQSDQQAFLELPGNAPVTVAVYTARPDVLRPLLAADPRLRVKFFSPAEYTPQPSASIMLLDRMAVPRQPRIASLWIDPPPSASPLPVKTTLSNAAIESWQSGTDLSTGLQAIDTSLGNAEVFQIFEGDLPVGNVSQGPVVVARPSNQNRPKLAVIGFDPLAAPLRFDVTTPLLFANLLRWISPEAFRALEISTRPVGAAAITLEPGERGSGIRVTDQRGFAVPFTVREQTLQLFSAAPGIVRIASGNQERILSLTLPDLAEFEWKPAPQTITGLPPAAGWRPGPINLWQWLALLGGVCLFIEWMRFGRRRVWKSPPLTPTSAGPAAREPDRELVSK